MATDPATLDLTADQLRALRLLAERQHRVYTREITRKRPRLLKAMDDLVRLGLAGKADVGSIYNPFWYLTQGGQRALKDKE